MRVVIQRVAQAQVQINQKTIGKIKQGLMLLVAFNDQDTESDLDYTVRKIVNMRIFEDSDEKMNLSIQDVNGSILSVSQFTLFANTKKGNRPSFVDAGEPKHSQELYDEFNQKLKDNGMTVETGSFGADMQVSLINDGPVTIILDSHAR